MIESKPEASSPEARPDDMPDLDLELPQDSGLNTAYTMQMEAIEKPVERRRNRRPDKRGSSRFRSIFRSQTDHIVSKVGSGWLGLTALVLSALLAVALLVWSVGYRVKVLDTNMTLAIEHTQREAERDRLLEKWSQYDLKEIQQHVSNAENKVFTDYATLAFWLNRQAVAAEQLSLNLRYTMGDASPSNMQSVAEITIDIHITAKKAVARQSYLRTLEFIRSMIDDRWHLEIASAKMNSAGKGVSSMSAVLHVWVHDEHINNNKQSDLADESTI